MNLIGLKTAEPAPTAVYALAERICALHGDALQAVLFYGSCLRSGEDRGAMVDLYALVDCYAGAYRSRRWALLNRLLPPNVFYLEVPFENRIVRAKYAVLSLKDLSRGTSRAWFHSYLWGRFAQPAALLYARRPAVAEEVNRALAQAVLTFLERVVPCAPPRFSLRELWLRGLSLSYRAELRAERPEKLAGLFQSSADYYVALSEAALALLPFRVKRSADAPGHYEADLTRVQRSICRVCWSLRALQGKALSILRLLKGAFTFTGGLDYILWKIERHTGVALEVPPRLKHRPILALCVLSWRLYRMGAFR